MRDSIAESVKHFSLRRNANDAVRAEHRTNGRINEERSLFNFDEIGLDGRKSLTVEFRNVPGFNFLVVQAVA